MNCRGGRNKGIKKCETNGKIGLGEPQNRTEELVAANVFSYILMTFSLFLHFDAIWRFVGRASKCYHFPAPGFYDKVSKSKPLDLENI